ncbi:MAG: SDR family oxidoreductase [Dehalococcoidales bacterium]|nr:SDR family oxidoreductase [Dehalococcoidales bacterium]
MTQDNISINSLLSLVNRRAIVTGAAQGLGLAITKRLSEAGAAVLITDINETAAAKAAGEIRETGKSAWAFSCDVSSESQVKSMVDFAVKQMGGVDILVNNAGIFPRTAVLDTTAENFKKVLDVNITGTFLCSRYAGKSMIEQGKGGSIINLASIDGIHPSYPGMSAYDSSKGGVIMITRSLARELGQYDIRVNAIAPGGIKTEGARGSMSGGTDRRQQLVELKEFMARMVLGRMGQPDEIARVALFLASEMSSYITGITIVADGGYLVG